MNDDRFILSDFNIVSNVTKGIRKLNELSEVTEFLKLNKKCKAGTFDESNKCGPEKEKTKTDFTDIKNFTKLTDKDINFINDWSLNYSNINFYLYNKESLKNNPLDPKMQKTIDKQVLKMDTIMDKNEIPFSTVVYRGVHSLNYLPKDILKVGSEITFNGFVSTTIDKKWAETFTNNKNNSILMEINVPKGTKSIFIEKSQARNLVENELLLNRDLTYKVNSVESESNYGNNIYKIKLDIVESKQSPQSFQEVSTSFNAELGGFHTTDYKTSSDKSLRVISQDKADNPKLLEALKDLDPGQLPSQFLVMKMKESTPAKYYTKTDSIGVDNKLSSEEMSKEIRKVLDGMKANSAYLQEAATYLILQDVAQKLNTNSNTKITEVDVVPPGIKENSILLNDAFDFIKLNYNCPANEKTGKGPGSCSTGSSEINLSELTLLEERTRKMRNIAEGTLNQSRNAYKVIIENSNDIKTLISDINNKKAYITSLRDLQIKKFGYMPDDNNQEYINSKNEISLEYDNLELLKNKHNNIYNNQFDAFENSNKITRQRNLVSNLNNKLHNIENKLIEIEKDKKIDSIKKQIVSGIENSNLTNQEKLVLSGYSGSSKSTTYNQLSSDMPTKYSAEEEKLLILEANKLEQIINKVHLPGKVTTVKGLNEETKNILSSLGAFEIGNDFTYSGFISTTFSKSVASQFATIDKDGKKLFAEFVLPQGIPAVYIDAISKYHHEDELLVNRGLNFICDDIKETSNSRTYVFKISDQEDIKEDESYLNEVSNFIKLNYNCPDSEKVGSGKGSCGGGKTENTTVIKIQKVKDFSKLPKGQHISNNFKGKYTGYIFHGTTPESAVSISKEGFKPSSLSFTNTGVFYATDAAGTGHDFGSIIVSKVEDLNIVPERELFDPRYNIDEKMKERRWDIQDKYGENHPSVKKLSDTRSNYNIIGKLTANWMIKQGIDGYVRSDDWVVVTNPKKIKETKIYIKE